MDAPTPPDPYETAAAQGSANTQASIAGSIVNNFNQRNPYGTVKYKKIGTETVRDAQGKMVKVPRYKQVTTLSPGQQRLYDQQTRLGQGLNDLAIGQVGRLDSLLGKPLDFGALPDAPTGIGDGGDIVRDVGPTDFSADRQKVEDAIFGRVNQQFDRDEDLTRARLAAQGLAPGSESYGEEIDRLGRARSAARTDAVLAGGQEQSRLANLALQRGGFSNAAQAQAFGQNAAAAGFQQDARRAALAELLAERNQPINEIGALMGGGQVSIPEAMPAYRQAIDAAPVGDYITNNYNQRMNAYRTGLSGLFGLGNAVVGGLLSDRRLKTDIRRVGASAAGLPIYTFRYRGGDAVHMGVMADEVEPAQPAAVSTVAGVKRVDYAQIR